MKLYCPVLWQVWVCDTHLKIKFWSWSSTMFLSYLCTYPLFFFTYTILQIIEIMNWTVTWIDINIYVSSSTRLCSLHLFRSQPHQKRFLVGRAWGAQLAGALRARHEKSGSGVSSCWSPSIFSGVDYFHRRSGDRAATFRFAGVIGGGEVLQRRKLSET